MKKTKMKAFTLVEMAIVIFIISLLILIIMPNVAKQRSNAEKVNTQALQAELDTQAQLYADEKELRWKMLLQRILKKLDI